MFRLIITLACLILIYEFAASAWNTHLAPRITMRRVRTRGTLVGGIALRAAAVRNGAGLPAPPPRWAIALAVLAIAVLFTYAIVAQRPL